MGALRAVAVVMALAMSSCTPGAISPWGGVAASLAGGLRPFSDCDEFLAYVREHALERVTPWGLPGAWEAGPDVALEAAVGAAAPGVMGARPVEGIDYSGTNVQTVGVDEPDIVKTDGERLVALSGSRLHLVELGSAPELRGSLRLGDLWVRDLLLLGDRVLLFGEAGGGRIPRPLLPGGPEGSYGAVSTLVEVDVSDPARPRVARRLFLDGGVLSARMADGVVRVVVTSHPARLPFEHPESGGLVIGGLKDRRDTLERNREVIRTSTADAWMPWFVLEGAEGTVEAEGSLLDCASASHPPEFSGFSMLSVLTLDLSNGLDGAVRERSVGVLSDGDTIYASPRSLYVATQRWMDWEAMEGEDAEELEGHVTRIHRFDITGADRARYRSSGRVDGWILNQFAMDEHEGHLRVASTDSPPFWGEAGSSSESLVTVLAEREGTLAEVGRVDGLGVDERIYAVRFLGDLGYVVTFREVDPLYVVDLSDPTSPRVEGELKIPGYSAYLHPLGDDLLLGVGQDATRQGRLKGTQVSLFDVSDPSDPRRLDVLGVSDASSEAEWDHHAFLYWQPEGLAVLPLDVHAWRERGEAFSGAVAIRVEGTELREDGRISHEEAGGGHDWGWGIRRSLVVGDRLLTVSDAGVEAVDLRTLEDATWVPFR